MQVPTDLTPEQSDAMVACLQVLARHGRAIREQREREQQKTESPSNLAGAGDSVEATDTNFIGVCTDARTL